MTSDKHDDGGPAFPLTHTLLVPSEDPCFDGPHHEMERSVGGMTLLDWFAGQVVAMLNHPGYGMGLLKVSRADGQTISEYVAATAYDQAAALIAEKRRREGE